MVAPLTVLVWVLMMTIPVSQCEKNCPIKYHGVSEHSACLPKSPRVQIQGLISGNKEKILEEHNKIRSQVTPSACRMNRLYWDNDLAYVAQQWSSYCKLTYDKEWQRHIPGKFSAGQNIAVGLASWEKAIESWYKESEKFKNGKRNAYSIVRHYVQMIQESISRIGCGFSECSNDAGRFFVCNYGPGPFKMEDLDNPYETCNKSFSLRDCNGDACLNGGVLYDISCFCRCPQEELYPGKFCELNCDVPEDPCPCKINYTTANCHKDVNIRYLCPNLCGICPYFAMPDSGMTLSVDGTCLAFSVAIFHLILLST